jgi:predicted neuraminidase
MKKASACFVALLFVVGADADEPAVQRGEFLFEKAPHPSCHASTIVQARQGHLVAAWFGGTRERNPDVGIWLSRQVDGRWTEPVEVANGVQYLDNAGKPHRYPCWNPVLYQPGMGPLLLFYKVGPSPSSWWGMLTSSGDGGRTFSHERRLPEGILGGVKNQPLQLSSGDLLFPSSTEHDGWQVHFERTANLGDSWSRTGPINDGKEIGIIQPCLLPHANGQLQALCRTRGSGRISETWSADGGKTWSKPALIALPNPNSGIDAIKLKDERFLLVYNHTPKGRNPLNVAVSKDGKIWQAALVLEHEPGEYSYPQVMQASDGMVHIVYTWKRLRIKHVVLDPAKIQGRDYVDGQWPQ